MMQIAKINHHEFRYMVFRPRKRPLLRAWLPRYHFVEFDIDCDKWQILRDLPGALTCLGPSDKPTPLCDGEMARLGKMLPLKPSPEQLHAIHPTIRAGDRVRVSSGPFLYLEASVLSCDGKRLKLELPAFAKSASIDMDDVELMT